MDGCADLNAPGAFEARYLAFLETISHLRPSLHRYCSRMTGSVSDGEDVVQDALFQAYRKLETFDDRRPLAPWLFRIAHNRCIDFLRRREVLEKTEADAAGPHSVAPVHPPPPAPGRAAGRPPRTGAGPGGRASRVVASSRGARLRALEGRIRLFAGRSRGARRFDRRRRQGRAPSRPFEARGPAREKDLTAREERRRRADP